MYEAKIIIIEGDNFNIIKFVQRIMNKEVKLPAGSYQEDFFFLRRFNQVIIQDVNRECNKLANYCANIAKSSDFVWDSLNDYNIPPFFVKLLKEECDNCHLECPNILTLAAATSAYAAAIFASINQLGLFVPILARLMHNIPLTDLHPHRPSDLPKPVGKVKWLGTTDNNPDSTPKTQVGIRWDAWHPRIRPVQTATCGQLRRWGATSFHAVTGLVAAAFKAGLRREWRKPNQRGKNEKKDHGANKIGFFLSDVLADSSTVMLLAGGIYTVDSVDIARIAIDMPINAHAATPPAKPSSPSVKLTPLPIAAKQNVVKVRISLMSITFMHSRSIKVVNNRYQAPWRSIFDAPPRLTPNPLSKSSGGISRRSITAPSHRASVNPHRHSTYIS
ncbi:hypothetical protein IEQ34_003364 [Dendrobium chrysotoxum]|uniref:RNase H type-1 domain-containing protein n=1 Tax=Dendrobium chrysotoxum TaxID=161865 RepID=A0AAV7HGY8_DENCH|nr:hypothetical protein IEQ34_003364 [Dendrobium chrysotoxum]